MNLHRKHAINALISIAIGFISIVTRRKNLFDFEITSLKSKRLVNFSFFYEFHQKNDQIL